MTPEQDMMWRHKLKAEAENIKRRWAKEDATKQRIKDSLTEKEAKAYEKLKRKKFKKYMKGRASYETPEQYQLWRKKLIREAEDIKRKWKLNKKQTEEINTYVSNEIMDSDITISENVRIAKIMKKKPRIVRTAREIIGEEPRAEGTQQNKE